MYDTHWQQETTKFLEAAKWEEIKTVKEMKVRVATDAQRDGKVALPSWVDSNTVDIEKPHIKSRFFLLREVMAATQSPH